MLAIFFIVEIFSLVRINLELYFAISNKLFTEFEEELLSLTSL